MRDPIARAKSAIQYYFQTNNLDINQASENEILEVANKSFIIAMSRYQDTVKNIDKHFRAEDVLFMFYEEIMLDKKSKIETVTKFLGITECETDDEILEKRVNTSAKYEFSQEVHGFLKERLKETYNFVNVKFGYLPIGWND